MNKENRKMAQQRRAEERKKGTEKKNPQISLLLYSLRGSAGAGGCADL